MDLRVGDDSRNVKRLAVVIKTSSRIHTVKRHFRIRDIDRIFRSDQTFSCRLRAILSLHTQINKNIGHDNLGNFLETIIFFSKRFVYFNIIHVQ